MICGVFAGCGAKEQDAVSKDVSAENQADAGSSGESGGNVESDGVVVYDNGGVKITAATVLGEDEWGNKEAGLLIENTTDKNIRLFCSSAVVNGITVPMQLSEVVEAGQKTNGSLALFTSDLENVGITEIATIGVKNATIENISTLEKLADVQFDIVTSLGTDYVQKIDDSGEVVFEADGFCVVSKGHSAGPTKQKVVLLVKNGAEKAVVVHATNGCANGSKVFDIGATTIIHPGSVAFVEIWISNIDLETVGITDVKDLKDISFTIEIVEPADYAPIVKSDEIHIAVNP